MPWSGGTYTKGNAASGGWEGDASVGIGIEADRHDAQDDDFTAGINNALTKDGQNTPTTNLPMGGYKHTGVGNATSNDQYVALGQIDSLSVALDGGNTPTANLPMGGFKHTGVDDATAADQYLSYGQLLDVTKAVTTTGTAPNYEVTLTPAPSAYATGQIFAIRIHSNLTTNAGATLNVNGLGAKALKIGTYSNNTRQAEPYELNQRQVYYVVYDGTDDLFRILNPTFGGSIGNTFTPTIGSGTGSTAVINSGTCRYAYIGSNLVFVFYNLNVALSGATSGVISLSLPVNAAANIISQSLAAAFVSSVSGYTNYGALPFVQNATTIQVYRNDQIAFPIDSGMNIRINGIYQAA